MVSAAQSIGCVLQRLGCDCRIRAAAGRETSAGGERARSDDLEATIGECRASDVAVQCTAPNATTNQPQRLPGSMNPNRPLRNHNVGAKVYSRAWGSRMAECRCFCC